MTPLALLAAVAALAPVNTLAYADSPVVAFAQDGNRISWVTARSCLGTVRVRSLSMNVQRAVGQAGGGECRYLAGTRLVLGRDRAVWTHHETGNLHYVYVSAGALSERKVRSVTDVAWDMGEYGVGRHFGGLAADESLVVYSTVDVSVHGPDDCDLNSTCVPYVKGGAVLRFDGSRSRLVPGAPAAALLAASGRRIALVPAGVGGPTPRPKPNGPVEVRNSFTGARISSFSPSGRVRALAFGGNVVAVLVAKGPAKRVERYRADTGVRLGATPVPVGTADRLSTDAKRIVFRIGRTIRSIDVAIGSAATLAIAKAAPVGLSIEQGRVAWGESLRLNGKARGRIQAMELR